MPLRSDVMIQRRISLSFTIIVIIFLLPLIHACGVTKRVPPDEFHQPSYSEFQLSFKETPATDTAAKSEHSDQADSDPDSLEPGIVCVVTNNLKEAENVENIADSMGYSSRKRRALDGLGFVMIILEVPQGYTVRQGIAELRFRFPELVIDANHRYKLNSSARHNTRVYAKKLIGWDTATLNCGTGIRLGLVDTRIDLDHPALQGRDIERRSFLPDSIIAASGHHGTSVAALLIGKSPKLDEAGLLPESSLFVAEVFRQRGSDQIDTTTWFITRALDWLVSQNVQVINLSFGGPQNALLAFAVGRTLLQNVILVAAAGHGDPLGGPSFPAAQPGVIAVTAIDADLIPYNRSVTGSHISFSAPGVDIWVPGSDETGKFVSGTSFAAPFVTAAMASLQIANPEWTSLQTRQELEKNALDLGNPGWDPVFGWGLVQISPICHQQTITAQ